MSDFGRLLMTESCFLIKRFTELHTLYFFISLEKPAPYIGVPLIGERKYKGEVGLQKGVGLLLMFISWIAIPGAKIQLFIVINYLRITYAWHLRL